MTNIQRRPLPDSFSSDASAFERVLAARGLRGPADLDYGLGRLLPPAQLGQVHDAAVLLAEAVTAGAKVLIVGDFDADGATSCAVAIKSLRSFGLRDVGYLVPNRFEFGYGLSPEIVGVAAAQHPDIIVTVDNGISSVDGVYVAQQLGMSVLVTDHHLPGEEIPGADVIVNPNLPGDRFKSKNLAGVGVIFYVMLALRAELRSLGWFRDSGIAEPNMSQFLDLVALGTVADVVPLDQNNRILVQQGLNRIRSGKACEGIKALLNVAKRNTDRIAASDLGFAVGPRLNAAGRLDDMSLGIECLLSDDETSAFKIALELDSLNTERRSLELGMQNDAQKIVDDIAIGEGETPCAYVLSDETWHQGVVGLVASRIKERTNRPVVALAPGEEGEWKGSARSVEGVNVRDVLVRVDSLAPGLMNKFGGHAMAAGLSLSGAKLQRFGELFVQATTEMTRDKDWRKVIWSDGSLNANDFSLELAEQLRTSTPWGQSFPEPVFDGYFQIIDSKVVGERHLKLRLQPEHSSQHIDAICFGYLDEHVEPENSRVRIAYRLDVNEWQGRQNLQLIVQHLE